MRPSWFELGLMPVIKVLNQSPYYGIFHNLKKIFVICSVAVSYSIWICKFAHFICIFRTRDLDVWEMRKWYLQQSACFKPTHVIMVMWKDVINRKNKELITVCCKVSSYVFVILRYKIMMLGWDWDHLVTSRPLDCLFIWSSL